MQSKKELSKQSNELLAANRMITDINRDLEKMVEDRTRQVKQALVELDTFFYRSSHDFRRPITTFLGLAEVAKITVKDPSALELFEKVSETAKGLDKMLFKLQSISDVGAQQLVLKEVLLKEIIANVVNGFLPEIVKRKIEVQYDINLPVDRPFHSYPVLLNVILENLLENAVNFSAPECAYIKIRAYERDHFAIIEVEDNGEGIPKEYAHLIFDMYFRASSSSKGNGLGLYSVKKAIEKLDGQVKFTTVVNEGSVFAVSLPYHFQEVAKSNDA
jgi:signal transduction histidine kinase